MSDFHPPSRPATSGSDPALTPGARTAWLLGLFECPYSVGANPEEVLALCRETNYPHWAGMLNGNGLVERVPGNPANVRVSPCGILCLGLWLSDFQYGETWIERTFRAWRRWRKNYSQNPPRF